MRCFLFLILLMSLLGCSPKDSHEQDMHFVTWQGIGPDKWASIWLIKRHINPEAVIQFIPVESTPVAGIAFDIPGSVYYRGKTTTFEQLTQAFELNDHLLRSQMIDIIHDIEITPWGGLRNESSQAVELAFRGLQKRYGRENVSEECYLQLFDNVYKSLLADGFPSASHPFDPKTCLSTSASGELPPPAIPAMDIDKILSAMQKGKKVVFLDAREEEEFLEGHIPGAINVKLRDIDETVAGQYQDADIVVPYCVKDFRGYEVARSLYRYGNTKAVIMQPFGLKGWSSLNLPLQGSLKLSNSDAEMAMRNCMNAPEHCLRPL